MNKGLVSLIIDEMIKLFVKYRNPKTDVEHQIIISVINSLAIAFNNNNLKQELE